jgi:hyperosmotically inducible protein
MRNITLLLLLLCAAVATSCGREDYRTERTDSVTSSEPADADNTERNMQKVPEGMASADTPLDQGNTEEDIQITSSIRKSIVADKALSTNARNIKIISSSGNVTLRGPVKSEHEKSKIEAYAKMASGVDRVDNMLEVEKYP